MKLRYIRFTFLLLGSHLFGQQVKFIDLTSTEQRVELRYPPAVPDESGLGGGYGGMMVGDCGVDGRDPRSLTVSLQSVVVRQGDPRRPFEVDFKVLNTGTVPLELPIGMHLADLQPKDPSLTFNYLSLALAVSPIEDRGSTGYVELYGTASVPTTLITLKPGEWLRVEANVRFDLKLPPSGTVNLVPGYWIHRATFYPHPGGSSTDIENVCVNQERPIATFSVHRN